MKSIPSLLLIGFFGFFISCKTTTTNSNSIHENTENSSGKSTLTLMSEGYVKASVLDKTDSYDCGFIIALEEGEKFLYPLHLKEEFKKNDLKVWVLYRPIRPIQANCPDAMPVELEGMEFRN